MSCSTCFCDFLSNCGEEITVNAQLSPATDYTWIITDKFDRRYSGEFTTDADGFWTIPTSGLPDGLLTQYTGSLKLEVQDSTCNPVKFKVADEYNCIDFTVKGGSFVKDNLGCDFDAASGGGGSTSLILTSPDDTQWQVTVNDAGVLITTEI